MLSATHEQLEDRIDSALHASPHLNYGNMTLENSSGCIVLRGNVRTYYQKQMAQEAIKRIDGVRRVDNQLKVTWR